MLKNKRQAGEVNEVQHTGVGNCRLEHPPGNAEFACD